MAQTSWPFENIDTSETQYSQLFRNLGQGPVEGKGFELEPYADSTGMNVKVKSGQALVRGHYYDSTGTETITIPAADATNPRIDRIVLRLDPTANTILLHRLAGTPNASPSAPALTQTDGAIYDLPLAQVYVAANATNIAPGDVTDERTIFSAWTGSVAIADVTGLQTEINALDSAISAKQDIVSGVSNTEIGYLDGVTSAIQTQLDGKAPLTQPIEPKTGAYTLIAADKGDLVTGNGTFTITVPGNVFAAGDRVDFINIGSGTITFSGSSLTLNAADAKFTVNKQWAGATVFFTSATTAVLIGALA
jgi:hypothetical protein